MYAKIALLVLGLAVAVIGETCNCGRLKACTDAKKEQIQRTETKCATRCAKYLPGEGDQIQQCLKEKSDALDKLKDNQMNCLLNPAGGVCTAPRARRQSDPRNYFVQPGASDFQPASNRGKWIQPGAQTESAVSAGTNIDDLLKPYHDCTHKCLQELHPEKGEGLASGATQGAVDPIGRHLTAIEQCQQTEKCIIDTASLANVAQVCQSDKEDEQKYKLDVKLSFCRCMRGALGRSEADMPCGREANNGQDD